MKYRFQPALLLIILCCLLIVARFSSNTVTATGARTPAPAATPSVNDIAIGRCKVDGLPTDIEELTRNESRNGLVMDARPFAINQTSGKMSFNGKTGRVTILHMNPFVYNYTITVAQKELVTTALNDFIKLLLPQSLGKAVGTESGAAALAGTTPISKLLLIEARIKDYKSENCQASPDACAAIGEMFKTFDKLRDSELIKKNGSAFDTLTSPDFDNIFIKYTEALTTLRDVEANAFTTCSNAQSLNRNLRNVGLDDYFDRFNNANKAIREATTLANDLNQLVNSFNNDNALLESKPVPRCKGYNCIGQFKAYADAALEVLGGGGYQGRLDTLRANADSMKNMLDITEKMKEKEGLFARTITIIKKFELSEATISLNRTELPTGANKQEAANAAKKISGGSVESGTYTVPPEPVVSGGSSNEGTALTNASINNLTTPAKQNPTPAASPTPPVKEPAQGKANGSVAPGQLKEVVQIGQPRFTLSAGLVYSPLPRRTFQSVKGFTRDAQGNPTGNGSTNIVGFGENSPRRLLPMVLLNSRLLSTKATSLYFSFGISAKYDDNVDIEYLFGPSVSVLNNRALITFGVYGGKTQNLVSDVNIGDELPDTIGDAKLFRKSYTWKPGFSFSYNFSRPKKTDLTGGTAVASSPANDLKSEIRIGNIPFNLAVGLAYTSLEQSTYDEIVGFARNRQGELTNGQTLTRIVGLTSSSDYRLTPVVLLHSRLTNFGKYDFYVSTGLTGKKTDNNFDIEYLIGGSVNLYRRRVFLTFGTFVGKQQILGGDFFEGAQLGTSQNVTTQNRYVWKPAIAFSYDISRIIPRP